MCFKKILNKWQFVIVRHLWNHTVDIRLRATGAHQYMWIYKGWLLYWYIFGWNGKGSLSIHIIYVHLVAFCDISVPFVYHVLLVETCFKNNAWMVTQSTGIMWNIVPLKNIPIIIVCDILNILYDQYCIFFSWMINHLLS